MSWRDVVALSSDGRLSIYVPDYTARIGELSWPRQSPPVSLPRVGWTLPLAPLPLAPPGTLPARLWQASLQVSIGSALMPPKLPFPSGAGHQPSPGPPGEQ